MRNLLGLNSKKVHIFLIFGLIFSAFLLTLKDQDEAINPTVQLHKLESLGYVKQITSWNVLLYDCIPRKSDPFCNPKHQKSGFNPLEHSAQKWFREAKAGYAIFSRNLTREEVTWIEENESVGLVIPKQLANYSQLQSPTVSLAVGQNVDATYLITKAHIAKSKIIQILFDYRGKDYPGSQEIPIAFVTHNKLRDYGRIPEQMDNQAFLTRQIEVGLPAVLSAISLVLDHNSGFLSATVFAAFKGLRSYLYSKVEVWNVGAPIFLINLLYLPLIIFALLSILKLNTFMFFYPILGILSVGLQLGTSTLASNYLFWSDSITDAFSGYLGLAILAFFAIKKKQTLLDVKEGKTIVFGLLIFTFLTLAIANTQDIIAMIELRPKAFTNWMHFVTTPSLAIAALIKTGSVSKTIVKRETKAIADTELRRDLEISQKIQETLLPQSRGKVGKMSWRDLRYRCQTLSGDWHDIRMVDLKNGDQLLCAVIVDVTSHGLGPALMISNIIGSWDQWAESISDKLESGKTMEEIVGEAPEQIHRGLHRMRNSLGCSLAAIVVNETQGIITYCTAGHPGIMLHAGRKFQFLESFSSRVGSVEGTWTGKSVDFPKGDWILALYTDGICPPGLVSSQWAARIKRSIRRDEDENLAINLAQQIRNNKKLMRTGTLAEDDMTLLLVTFKESDIASVTAS